MQIETTCSAWVVEETNGLYVYTSGKPDFSQKMNTWVGGGNCFRLPCVKCDDGHTKKLFTLPTGKAVEVKIIVEVDDKDVILHNKENEEIYYNIPFSQ